MNELNLMEILKDCPKGTKLYSTIHGEVEFDEIVNDDEYSIRYRHKNIYNIENLTLVTKDGRFYCNANGGECVLFPSKDQRDWSKFKVEPEMIDGEFYYCVYNYNQKENHVIFIYKKHIMYKTNYYAALDISHSISSKNSLITNNNIIITELRKATEKEKQRLLNTIEIEGYKWDADKKELIEPKFDISILQPFDKVLVRDWGNNMWRCAFYEGFGEDKKYPFITTCGLYTQCIPYNEETKHLVRTNEMPPKKYITWEE